ncbi:MAG TPA: MaoC family dehydratase N-terminal domain-containing protein [Acetobacteraceae bacterium]|nr:MaoC family dehydratase N-terminal domain-containing protein [Acetobacteraceae bacterium]
MSMRINYITTEVRAVIGAHNGPILACHPVEASEVRRFFQAVMDPAPRYHDEAWVQTSRYAGLVAPPAFPTHAHRRAPEQPDPLDYMSEPDFDGISRSFRGLPRVCVPLPRVLNGGYEYEFFRYARIGECIWRSSAYLDIFQRDGRNGPMVFVIVADTYTADGGVRLIDTLTTSILR